MGKLRYLLPLGLLALLAARAFGDAIAAAPFMIWIGLALAARWRPSLAAVVRERRRPSRGEIGAALTGVIIAYLLFGAVDQGLTLLSAARFQMATGGDWRPDRWVPQAMGLAWLAIALVPAAVHCARRSPDATVLAVEGLLAAIPFGLVLFLAWQMVGRDLASAAPAADLVLRLLALPPLVGVLGALGGVAWLRALTPSLDGPPAFAWALRAAFVGWSGVSALSLAVLGVEGARDGLGHGLGLALLWLAVIAGVWLAVLVELRDIEPASPWRAAAGAAALALTFLISTAPAHVLYTAGRTEIGDASGLVALFLAPLWIGLAFLCWKTAPRMVRSLVA